MNLPAVVWNLTIVMVSLTGPASTTVPGVAGTCNSAIMAIAKAAAAGCKARRKHCRLQTDTVALTAFRSAFIAECTIRSATNEPYSAPRRVSLRSISGEE